MSDRPDPRTHRGTPIRRTVAARARVVTMLGVFCALVVTTPVSVNAQYFGRNQVQYDRFEFRSLETPNFDLYYYDKNVTVAEDLARMSERWYERLARLFQHEFEERKPLIFYADHPDFQQTNTVSGQITEGVGGVTESLKNRVVMPIGSYYAATDHVLGHELVHAFQYNLAQSRRGGGLQGLFTLPLWMIEGMAEYLSVGREDPLTAMWLRDAILRDDFPTLQQLTRDRRFFPYRFGQAFWTYIGGAYGDETVVRLFRTALRTGWAPAIETVLGIPDDTLSVRWKESVENDYRRLMADRMAPAESGSLLLSPATGAGNQNVAPAISPDGTRLLYISERDIFSFNLYVADAHTGETIRQLASAESDPHTDAIRFIDSSGAWSPDSREVAFVVFAGGRNELVITDADRGRQTRRIQVPPELGEITGPTWMPDGRGIVFSSQIEGATNLFMIELETEEITRLTEGRHASLQPAVSPDGRTVAFVSDRGPETDFDRLVYSEMRIVLLDLESGELTPLDIFGDVRHSNPQFTPDGRGLYFLSDPDGFSDIFRLEFETGEVQRVTRVATGVSGITSMSPAMSVATQTGTVVFSVFDGFEFHVYSVDSRDLPASPVVNVAELNPEGRFLPPLSDPRPSRIMAYLSDDETGLPPVGTHVPRDTDGYDRGLSLDFITQPTVGAGMDRFGTFVGGSIAAFFSDMLGNRNMGVAVQAQGRLQDIGGQFVYQNLENRWNWGVGGGRIPYPFFGYSYLRETDHPSLVELVVPVVRLYQTQGFGLASYPLNQTRRFDFAAGLNRYSYDIENDVYLIDPAFRIIDHRRESVPSDQIPPAINLFEASAAYVGDNSFFGFVSPIRGGRFRAEIGATYGSVNFHSLTLDYRRYFNPTTNLTLAVRGMHFGRYGSEVEDQSVAQGTGGVIQDLYVGWDGLVRGYSPFSIDQFLECRPTSPEGEFGFCPVYERLFGQRLAVLNVEARVPLFGTDRYGVVDFGIIPTEIAFFADAGLAWSGTRPPVLEWHTRSDERIPVVSAGVSSRMNLFGALIFEIYYAYPFQRPDRNGIWGFHLAPGW